VRPAQAVMAELAAAGLTPAQLALVMELSAAVATEARPTIDHAAENKRAYDREYRKAHPRTKSYDNNEPNDLSPDGSPKDIYQTPSLTPVSKTQWAAFRSQRRKALNARSYTLLCNKLTKLAEDGWPPGDMIDLAIERGWETVFAPRTPNHGQSTSNVTSLRGSRPDPALDLSEPRVPPKIARIISELGLRYRPSVQADLEAHAATLALLTRDVAHMKPDTLERACARQWAQQSPYMPKAAELISLCRALDRPNADTQARIDKMNWNIAEVNEGRRARGQCAIRWTLRGEQWIIEENVAAVRRLWLLSMPLNNSPRSKREPPRLQARPEGRERDQRQTMASNG
jgi:hypothetical protein